MRGSRVNSDPWDIPTSAARLPQDSSNNDIIVGGPPSYEGPLRSWNNNATRWQDIFTPRENKPLPKIEIPPKISPAHLQPKIFSENPSPRNFRRDEAFWAAQEWHKKITTESASTTKTLGGIPIPAPNKKIKEKKERHALQERLTACQTLLQEKFKSFKELAIKLVKTASDQQEIRLLNDEIKSLSTTIATIKSHLEELDRASFYYGDDQDYDVAPPPETPRPRR